LFFFIFCYAAEFAKLPLIPPYLQMKDGEFMAGTNFASGGAGALVDTYKGFVCSFSLFFLARSFI